MYEQILTYRNGETVKILLHYQDIYIISFLDNHIKANSINFTKEELIAQGWIIPVEKWTPEIGEEYYVPYFADDIKYNSSTWTDHKLDNHRLANNLVCRTKEEAIALTDKMLGAVSN